MAKLRHENHNKVKIKALLFLKMRQDSDNQWAAARAIARAIEGNADSLYVLLSRWAGATPWARYNRQTGRREFALTCTPLVQRLNRKPFAYAITKEGRRYLSNLNKWYPGDIGKLCQAIAVSSEAVFWWRKDNPDINASEPVFFLEAPFGDANNFHRFDVPLRRNFGFSSRHLLTVKCSNAYAAMKQIKLYGFKWEQPLAQALVDAKFVTWSSKDG
ncbi:hypothetical protein ACFLX7_03360 [Chloroflexota bacterium]